MCKSLDNMPHHGCLGSYFIYPPVDSEHTAWFVMHSSQIAEVSNVPTHAKSTAIYDGQSKNAFRILK